MLDAEKLRMHMIIMEYGNNEVEVVCERASEMNASVEMGGVDEYEGAASSSGMSAWLAGFVGIVAVFSLL